MAEAIVLLVIAAGIYARRPGRWEWSRESLQAACERAAGATERLFTRSRGRLPGVLSQCVADVRALVDDLLGVLDPRARKRIEHRARALLANRRAARRSLAGTPGFGSAAPAGAGAAGGPASDTAAGGWSADRSRGRGSAIGDLQRQYLTGAIDLDQYVEKASQIRSSGA